MNRRRISALGIVIVTTVILVVGVAGYSLLSGDAIYDTKQKHSDSVRKITIGWIGPLSGPVALLGLDSVKAVQLAVSQYNEAKAVNEPEIKLVIEDDQYDSRKSLTAYQKLVAVDNVDIVILNTYSAMFLVADEALEDGVIVVNPIDNDANLAKLNENMFMIAKETEQLGVLIANAMLDQGNKKAFILYFSGDDFMPTLANVVKDAFERDGGTVIMQRYTKLTSSFTSPIFTGKEYNADAHVLLGYAELGKAMKHARDAGVTAQFYTANAGMAEGSAGAIEGTRLTDFTYLDCNIDEAKPFLDLYRTKYNEIPAISWTALQSYDATRIIIDAIRKASTEQGEFVENMREHMLATHEFKGVTGNISIKPDGTSRGIYWSLYTFTEDREVKNNGQN